MADDEERRDDKKSTTTTSNNNSMKRASTHFEEIVSHLDSEGRANLLGWLEEMSSVGKGALIDAITVLKEGGSPASPTTPNKPSLHIVHEDEAAPTPQLHQHQRDATNDVFKHALHSGSPLSHIYSAPPHLPQPQPHQQHDQQHKQQHTSPPSSSSSHHGVHRQKSAISRILEDCECGNLAHIHGPASSELEDHQHLSVGRQLHRLPSDHTKLSDALTCVNRSAEQLSSATLHWPQEEKWRILIIKKIGEPSLEVKFKELLGWLAQTFPQIEVYLEPTVYSELKSDSTGKKLISLCHTWSHDDEASKFLTSLHLNVVLSLGGDGTLLYIASLFQSYVPPIVCFNLGTLGFLTPFPFSNYQSSLLNIIGKECSVTLRMRLRCEIVKGFRSSHSNGSPNKKASQSGEHRRTGSSSTNHPSVFHALNELVVDRGPSPFIGILDVYCDDILITEVQGDGLIIATPTGSTAYSVAAGGSMVHPLVQAMLLTPICPHSLSFRPIVVPVYARLKIVVAKKSRSPAWISMDGRHRQKLEIGDSIIITASPYPVPTVVNEASSIDWFESLHSNLSWNIRRLQTSSGPTEDSIDAHSPTSNSSSTN